MRFFDLVGFVFDFNNALFYLLSGFDILGTEKRWTMVKKRRKTSFRKRLQLSYLLVSLLAVTIFAVIIFVHTTNQLRDNQFAALKNGAHALKVSVDSYMHSIDMMLSSIHADANIQKYLRNEDPDATQSDVHSVLLMLDVFARRTNGIQIFSSKRSNLFLYNQMSIIHQAVFSNENVKDEIWYQNTEKANGLTCWYYDEDGDLDHVPCFYATRTVYNTRRPSEKMGVIRISVANTIVQNLLDLSFYSEGDAVLLIEGKPVLSTMKGFEDNEDLAVLINQKDKQGELIQNQQYFAVSTALGYKNWSVLVLLPRKALAAKQLNSLYPILAMWGAMLIVTLIYSGSFAAYLSKPLNNLYEKMTQFSNVNDISIDVESGEEISYLYQAFNAMGKRIDTLVEQEKENEIRMLQSQINPHFVYNTLESLRAMATMRGAGDIAEMIGTFGTYFRECLNKGRFYSTIDHELNHACSYLKIQHLRYPSLFSWDLDVDDEVYPYYVPHAVLQPLIENAIIHGFDGMDDGGYIRICAKRSGGTITLSVSDNGCGADWNELNNLLHGEGYKDFCCIRNVWLRLQRFSTQAFMEYSMNEDGGLTVTMKFEEKEEMKKERQAIQ